jgi:flavorubredoxin
MRKAFKIIIAVLAIFVIIIVAIGAVFFLDLASYTATGVRTLPQQGTAMGTALVLYDPGLSGATTRLVEKIAADLQNQSLTVTIAGIKSSAAANTTGYDIIVIGGPIYAGAPTASIKDALSNLQRDADTKVGVFGSGQGATSADDIAQIKNAVPALQSGGALSKAIVVKIGETEDLDARASDFVTQVLK